jgi:hypothetical protein
VGEGERRDVTEHVHAERNINIYDRSRIPFANSYGSRKGLRKTCKTLLGVGLEGLRPATFQVTANEHVPPFGLAPCIMQDALFSCTMGKLNQPALAGSAFGTWAMHFGTRLVSVHVDNLRPPDPFQSRDQFGDNTEQFLSIKTR